MRTNYLSNGALLLATLLLVGTSEQAMMIFLNKANFVPAPAILHRTLHRQINFRGVDNNSRFMPDTNLSIDAIGDEHGNDAKTIEEGKGQSVLKKDDPTPFSQKPEKATKTGDEEINFAGLKVGVEGVRHET